MLANFTLTQFVNLCLQGCTQGTSLMQICKVPNLARTHLEKSALTLLITTKNGFQIWELLRNRNSKLTDCSTADGFWGHCNTLFESMCCFCHFCFRQEEQPAPPTEDDFQRRLKTRELFQLRKRFIEEKCYIVVQMIECERWMLCQTDVSKKEHFREFFRYNCPLVENQ